MSVRTLAAAGCAIALCLSGCATLAPDAAQVQPAAVLAGDPPFELSGRIALRQGDRALSATLRWRYDGTLEEMLLTGPLGAGAAEIVRDKAGVSFRSGQHEQRAPDVAALMQATLGYALPLDGLRYWARGQTGPGAEARAVERDARGRLIAFEREGWRVAIAAYAEAPLDALPRRVNVDSGFDLPGAEPGTPAAPLQVRLLIDEWVHPPGVQ